MTNPAPSPIEVADFQFKLQCRLNIFQNEFAEEFGKVCSLVASASRFGLIFVGTKSNSFQVIQVQQIEHFEKDVSNYTRRTVDLPSRAHNISANCDSTKLSVIVEKDGCVMAIIYDILSFFKQNVTILKEIRLSATPGVSVLETDWNPALPDIFTACKDDGTLGVYEFKGQALDINELPSAAACTCFCWSPKGKQIAVGSRDGKITQYKPDLKAVKAVNAPPLNAPHSIISLKWISNFQFIGIYNDGSPNGQSQLIVVDAPKAGNPIYTSYEDICFSFGNTRPQQFYMLLQQHWNILMVASSNSMEVGVMGLTSDKWMQWLLGDSCRAELPLSSSKQDTVPLGAAINTGSIVAPSLYVLSHHGVLCCFNVLNSRPGIPSVCSPPEPVADKSGLHMFVQGTAELKMETPKVTPVQEPPILIAPTIIPNIPKSETTPAIVKPLFTTAPPFGLPPVNQAVPAATSIFGKPAQESQTNLPFGNLSTQKIQSPQPQHPIQIPKTPDNTVKQSSPIILQPPKPAEPIDPNIAECKKEPQTPSKRKVDGRIPISVETEAMIAQLVRDECITLESELKVLLHRCKAVKINIGNDTDSTGMAKKAIGLEEFLKALKETSTSQEAEIHTLKQCVIQTWAWYEEARSRFNSSQDPKLISLLQAQPLDPASKRQLEEVNHYIYYLDSQLIQANKSLDEQWDMFQDSLSKTTKMQIPTMEAIYQSIMKQNSTIQKQKYILKYISSRIKTCNKHQVNSNILISLDKANNLEEELKKLQICPEVIPHIQYKKVLEQQQKFNEEKSQKLFKFLQKRNVTHISISKPQLNDSTIHLSTLLTEPISPIAPNKKLQPNKIDFMSTTEQIIIGGIQTGDNKINNFGTTSTPFNKQIPSKAPFGVLLPSASITTMKLPLTSINQNATTSISQNNLASNKVVAFSIAKTQIFGSTQNVTSKPSLFGISSSADQQGEISPKVIFHVPKYTAATTVATTLSKPTTSNVFVAITKPSTPLFGNVSSATSPISSVSSMFGDNINSITITPSPTTTKSIFNFTPDYSITDAASTTVKTTTITGSTTKTTSIFTTQPAVVIDSKTASIFGTKSSGIFVSTAAATTAQPTTTAFGTSHFGSSSGTSLFGTSSESITTNSASKSIFGSSITCVSTTAAPKTVSSMTNIFSSSTTANIFATTTTATSSVFASSNLTMAATTPTTVGSIFATATTTNASIFYNKPTTTASSSATGSFFKSTSAFGSTPTTTQSSVFADTATSFPSKQPASLFADTPTTSEAAAFGNTAPESPEFAAGPTSSQTSIFGGTSNTTQASIFGGAPTTQTSVFASSSTTPSIFGVTSITTTAAPVFGVPLTTVSVFGPTPTTTTASVFGPTPTTTASVFGPTPTTTASVFGTQPTTTASVFGSTPTTASVFGSTPTTTASVFGTKPTTTASVFGATPTTTTSVFGVVSTTAPSVFESTATTPSVFGATQAATTTSTAFGGTTSPFGGSPFGATSPSTTTFGSTSPFATTFGAPNTFGAVSSSSNSPFAQQTTFGAGSVFGGNTSTTNSSVFGGNTAAFSSNSNVFGNTPTTSTPFGGTSVFGAAVTSSTPFGGSTGAPFGQPTQSSFSSSGGTFGGAFGGNSGNANTFSFNSLNVGATTTTSTSGGFGAGFAQANPFGRTTSQEQKSPFGQSGGSLFGTPTTSTTSVFGGGSPFNKSAGFGSPPTFGSPSTFGAQSQSFGQNSFSGGFGSPTVPQGSFSASGQTVQQSGFGSPAFQKTNTGFGSAPVFGSPSATGFGSTPSFSTPPAFGTSATFGSPGKVFGTQTTESSNFGNMAQNSNFGNLANQNTVGFGNLAQQAGSPSAPSGFSGGSSFSSWR